MNLFSYPDDLEILENWNRNSTFKYFRDVRIEKQTARQFCFEIYWQTSIQLLPSNKTWALLNVQPKILQLNVFYLVWMWVAAVDFMSLSLSIAVRVDFFLCHGANFCHNSLMPCLLHQSFIVEIHNHWELLMDHGKSIIFQNNRDLYNKFFKIVLLSIELYIV